MGVRAMNVDPETRFLAYGLLFGAMGAGLAAHYIYKKAAPVVTGAFESEDQDEVDRMPGATQIVDNMMERTNANAVLFEKNDPTLWPAGGLTVVNIVDAIKAANNLPDFPTATI